MWLRASARFLDRPLRQNLRQSRTGWNYSGVDTETCGLKPAATCESQGQQLVAPGFSPVAGQAPASEFAAVPHAVELTIFDASATMRNLRNKERLLVRTLFLAVCALLPISGVPYSETISDSSLASKVTIRRDQYGIPHILAETEEAAAFGFGFAQAEDHCLTIARGLFAARGEEAKYFGTGTESDFLLKLYDNLGVARTVKAPLVSANVKPRLLRLLGHDRNDIREGATFLLKRIYTTGERVTVDDLLEDVRRAVEVGVAGVHSVHFHQSLAPVRSGERH